MDSSDQKETLSKETLSTIFKFQDGSTIVLQIDDMTIKEVVNNILLQKNNLTQISTQIGTISDTIYQQIKLIFAGKPIQINNTLFSAIVNLQPDSHIYCIMPELSATEIEEIKQNIIMPDKDIATLLSTKQVLDYLKISANYNRFVDMINMPYTAQLDSLNGMGFDTTPKLIQLLIQHNGDMTAVLNDMLQ